LVSGRVVSVVGREGIIALCKIGNEPSDPSMTIFVRGITWLADGEVVLVKAKPTKEIFKYTSVMGAAKTIRIYELAR
jgi:hypothetical protein